MDGVDVCVIGAGIIGAGIIGLSIVSGGISYHEMKVEKDAVIERLERELEDERKKVINGLMIESEKSLYENMFGETSEIRGFRNNNPGNLRGKHWFGQIGNDSSGFIKFTNAAYGIRAIAKLLVNYEKKGLNTIRKIVGKYSEDANTDYIEFLCKKLRVTADEKINVKERLAELVDAIIQFECGHNPYPDEYFTLLSYEADL